MSGRLCSSACADFFERDPPPVEEPPDRRAADDHAAFGQGRLQFGQGDVQLGLEQRQDQVRVLLDAARAPITAQRAGARIALRQGQLPPADRAGGADPEPRRRRAARQPTVDRGDNPLA